MSPVGSLTERGIRAASRAPRSAHSEIQCRGAASEGPLPDAQRQQARQRLVADRIRSRFFRHVFLRYFDRDSLGEEEIEAHKTILHWLESISQTPHLYPFMQGQTDSQKVFRLGRLLKKIIQINEMYQRVARASAHPTYRDRFLELGTRDRLAILAREHYPMLKVDSTFLLSTALCPFRTFARWVQANVAAHKQPGYAIVNVSLKPRGGAPGDEPMACQAVIGFDGLPITQYTAPKLTTVHVPAADMGRRAAQQLVAAIRDGQSPTSLELPTQLIVRGSTAPPARAAAAPPARPTSPDAASRRPSRTR